MDPEDKSLNFIFPTKHVIPKSLKFSHWLSEITGSEGLEAHLLFGNTTGMSRLLELIGSMVSNWGYSLGLPTIDPKLQRDILVPCLRVCHNPLISNPKKLEKPCITKGQYLAIFRVDSIM